jgi:hypothetical protein
MPAMERRALGQLMAEDGRLDQRHARRLWKRRDGSATPQRFVDDLPGNLLAAIAGTRSALWST